MAAKLEEVKTTCLQEWANLRNRQGKCPAQVYSQTHG